jgi:hypothetical protein
MTHLRRALDFAEAGISIFPVELSRAGQKWRKKPHIVDWPNRASTDPDVVLDWWLRWPLAAPGIPLGRMGWVVVDAEDVLIAARNGWTVGLDNLSWMTAEWSDTLCMLATGIASGTRAHYTNDEEHVYSVQRPVLFNGIPEDLIERSDLASRTIKLEILPLAARRTEADLAEEFDRLWPEAFGALLTGLVGALRDAGGIEVDDPARLMDFERFAEAGCRALGFREWEFVNAYAANRRGSMAAAVEASAVGRAVKAFMKKHPEGFAGKMSELFNKLETYRGCTSQRHWPTDPTRLSTVLGRLEQPLAAVGIECRRKENLRNIGSSQKGVVLKLIGAEEPDGAEPL